MRVLVFGNSGSGKSTLAGRLSEEHGLSHLDLDSIVSEPGKVAVQRSMDAMLENLQAWVAGYYERQDQWSYHAHRRIFDSFAGRRSERPHDQIRGIVHVRASQGSE